MIQVLCFQRPRPLETVEIIPVDRRADLCFTVGNLRDREASLRVDTFAEQIFFTTVRIDTVSQEGGAGSGTGFIFNYIGRDQSFHFVVTNKHVVEGKVSGTINFVIGSDRKPNLGEVFKLNIDGWSECWFGHSDPDVDICLCPAIPMIDHIEKVYGKKVFYRSIPSTLIPNEEQIADLDAIERVAFVGYPNGVWDRVNYLPVARRGTTATPISINFEGTPRFIIDASVFGGSSGSPVFLASDGVYATRDGQAMVGARTLFVGVVAAVFYRSHLNEIVSVPIPTDVAPMARGQEMIDLGIVFRSGCVKEAAEQFLQSRGFGDSVV